MTLQDLISLEKGDCFLYKGRGAIVTHQEAIRFLIYKGTNKKDKDGKDDKDVFFQSWTTSFTSENGPVSITSCFPYPEKLELDAFECQRLRKPARLQTVVTT